MVLNEVLERVRSLAPEGLAEDWDKVGLHLGDGDWPVTRALLCIDLTEPVLAEAAAAGAELIVAYHPPIFAPVARLTVDDWKGRILLQCAQRRIAIYSPHTALDAAAGGVNDWLAAAVGPGEVTPIVPAYATREAEYKFVTFVPSQHADAVRDALAAAGAGWIGNYSHCSFNLAGEGTFRGESGANPVVGEAGRLEKEPEIRMEMICPPGRLNAVVTALWQAHPYEEPAFDIYPLVQRPMPMHEPDKAAGLGRRVVLDEAVNLATLAARVKAHLGVDVLEVGEPVGGMGNRARPQAAIKVVAVCAGAGGSVVTQVNDADAYLTGEMRHHDILAVTQQGKAVLLAGHTQTERPYLPTYRDRLAEQTGSDVAWQIAQADVPASVMG